MLADWRHAGLTAADRALCAFAEELTASPWWVTRESVEALRARGFDDRAIHDAVQVVAYFNYINRVADGLGTDIEPGMPEAAPLWRWPAFACPARAAEVTLAPVTKENLAAVLALQVSPPQRWFVATNAVSLAQASVDSRLRVRAICAAGVPVGFVMLEPQDDGATIYIVRFMIDHRAQGCGFGAEGLRRVIEDARSQPGIRRITLSYVPGAGSPKPFYERRGFKETGETDPDGEVMMELALS